MEIFIVNGVWDYEGSEIVGVFSSAASAQAKIADDQLTNGEEIQGEWYPRFDSYSIVIEEVKA